MYLYDKNRITYFAETDRRNKRVPFGIKAEDRTRHMYIIGKTGMGKSTMIENMAVQDIKNGEGFAFIDPHGKSAAFLLEYIPAERVKDVIYFAPFDMENPISFNIMEDIGPDKRHLVANGLMSVFKKIWVDAWSARMEYILSNVLLALLEYPDSTLLGVNRMLADKAYRKKVVDNIQDPSVKSFWVDEYAKYSEKYAAEATPAIQNKIGQFTSNPLIRNIIGQPHSSFDLRKIMDERKILIVNLSKGQVGEGNANLLGSMIITKIYLSAMSRADLVESELRKLPNFYLYVDEFQSFANESFANILSEARKYKLALIMAHQYIEQMSEEVTAAVFGNVGTQIMFRVGATDAEHLEKEYAPVFTAEDMVNLGFTQIYLKLMIDGVASHPFSAVTMPPILPPEKSSKDEVIRSSREIYAHPRQKVEESINAWYGPSSGDITPPPSSNFQKGEHPLAKPISKQYSEYGAKPSFARQSDNEARENTRAPYQRYQPIVSLKQNIVSKREKVKKTEKPFAQAFKDLEKETTRTNIPRAGEIQKEISKELPLATLLKEKPVSNIPPPKNLDNDNLNELKNALASILKEKKEKVETPSVPSPHKEKPRAEDTTLKEKEKEQEEPKIREVPEDVLTAILSGED
ncbi:MAG: type IV secretion system DNA-binding domain-containing protein [Candidatus Yonathbacteria bacterium]|nr:type IV secretion system DNA-binding domain-containing protein [Candidatus Yonathbacteria bacterium]